MPEVTPSSPSGLTLPVWVAAAARAATLRLLGQSVPLEQPLAMPDGTAAITVPVCSVAGLSTDSQGLAMAVCDPGPGLDLTRGLEVWVRVAWTDDQDSWLQVVPGEGVGRFEQGGAICLSAFARQLLELNLRPLVPAGQGLVVEVVLPRGRDLAERTSNAAFGVIDGLALIGTQAAVQTSASPDQLSRCLEQVRELAAAPNFQGRLTLVIGENGRDLAAQLGFATVSPLLKTGNWIGPVLVAAAEAQVKQLVLFGYQGKLLKLAGGIFHTHHHLADGRLEVLTALAVDLGLPLDLLQMLRQAPSVEAALEALQECNSEQADALRRRMAVAVESRAQAYLKRYGNWSLQLGCVLFDRSRMRRWCGDAGAALLETWGQVL